MTSNTATVHRRREHARYGAASQQEFDGPLPQPFPREIGPRAMEYLAEVVDSGLTCDMVGRFEQAFAEAHGIAHCIAIFSRHYYCFLLTRCRRQQTFKYPLLRGWNLWQESITHGLYPL